MNRFFDFIFKVVNLCYFGNTNTRLEAEYIVLTRLETSESFFYSLRGRAGDKSNEESKQKYKQELKIELYNAYQKLVFEEKFERNEKSTELKIDTSKLPNGVYYLKIINEKEVYTERIIIEN